MLELAEEGQQPILTLQGASRVIKMQCVCPDSGAEIGRCPSAARQHPELIIDVPKCVRVPPSLPHNDHSID